MRRLRQALGAALVATAAVVGLVPAGADAATLAQAGWWWRVNDGALPATIPAPPTVPEGGLYVAGAPDGATAIAALHFDLAEGEAASVLTLKVAENGDQGGDTALLAACLTGSAWQPAQSGTWASKPFPACAEGSVNGVRSDDGATWTFAVAPLASDGIVDVTLVPGVDPAAPEGANGSSFQLAFEPPTAASLTTTSGDTSGGDFSVPDFGSSSGDFAGDTGSFDVPAFGDSGLAFPPAAPAAGFTPALPEADQGFTATAPVAQKRNGPLATAPISTVEDHKGLAALVLALCGAALLWSAQQPTPEPRRLGTFGAAAPGQTHATSSSTERAGLGRFARERTGPAPRL